MTDDSLGPDPETARRLEELALKRWPEVVAGIDAAVARFEDQALTARFGTPLAADDRKANPFHTSHVIQMLLSAGIDNLNGIRHLIWGRPPESSDRPVLHQATHFVLARAAIEDFATALWILGPSSRPSGSNGHCGGTYRTSKTGAGPSRCWVSRSIPGRTD